jgi:hypothetical protein
MSKIFVSKVSVLNKLLTAYACMLQNQNKTHEWLMALAFYSDILTNLK